MPCAPPPSSPINEKPDNLQYIGSESSLFSISPRGDASSHDGNEGEDLLEPDYVGVVADVRVELEVPVDGDQGVVLGRGKLTLG